MVRNMRDKERQSRRHLMGFMVWILLGLVFWGQAGISVRALEDSFVIEATKLPANEETYDIQLNIENLGSDWEGTVRLVVDEEYRCSTAYDTIISLPQGSIKQFVVKVPVNSIEDTSGTITVTLLDKEQKKTADKVFKHFLREEEKALAMGILSDDYSALTYLDMGGGELFFYGDEYPIRLVEITQDNLEATLETLEFLVIDTYNTGVLTDEERAAIETWNYDGGVLIVGTGAYAEDTLAGFQDSYLGVECGNIFTPDELGNYNTSEYVNMALLTLAELHEVSQPYNVQYLNKAWTCSYGNGAVGILPYSLTELAKMGDSFYQNIDQMGFVLDILDTTCMESGSRYNSSTYNQNYYNYNMLRRMLRLIGSVNSPLSFGVLKFLVIIYVIFVGPVLYIILRMLKKRELYWVAVPGAALLGILLIFFAGRGFEVVDTRVYSVTAQNLAGKRSSTSYLYCYDATKKEWDLKLSDGYDYIGALMNEQYNYEADKYYHHIKREGEVLSFGIRPSSNFEDSFFYAGKGVGSESSGSIDGHGISLSLSGIAGTVTNATEKDFSYYAVITNGSLYVYAGLGAGESRDLTKQEPIYSTSQGNDIWHDYMYIFLNDIRNEEEPEIVSALSALGIGICSVYTQEEIDKTVVIGVTENWNQTVDDECSEIAYGCLYVIQ